MALATTYGFTGGFETIVVARACTRPQLWESIGRWLDPVNLASEAARVVVHAARAIYKDQQAPAAGLDQIIQRVYSEVSKGRLAEATFDEVTAYLDAGMTYSAPYADTFILKEAIGPIRTSLEAQIAHSTVDSITKREPDFVAKLQRQLAELERVGKASSAEAIFSDSLDWDAIWLELAFPRFTTGVLALDTLMSGGLISPALWTIVGGAGSGKSHFLAQVAIANILAGRDVVVSTLELPRAACVAMIAAGLCNVTAKPLIEKHADSKACHAMVKQRYATLSDTGTLGRWVVEQHDPSTSIGALVRWKTDVVAKHGLNLAVFITDYLDRVSADHATGGGKAGTYATAGYTYEMARLDAVTSKHMHLTASQATRGSGARLVIEEDDLADSQHKPRISDGVISINKGKVDEASGTLREINYHVVKDRYGLSKVTTAMLPTMWSFGLSTELDGVKRPIAFEPYSGDRRIW